MINQEKKEANECSWEKNECGYQKGVTTVEAAEKDLQSSGCRITKKLEVLDGILIIMYPKPVELPLGAIKDINANALVIGSKKQGAE